MLGIIYKLYRGNNPNYDKNLGLSNGQRPISNQPNPTEPKPNGWIQMAWSVGYVSTFFENRNFGSGGRLKNQRSV